MLVACIPVPAPLIRVVACAIKRTAAHLTSHFGNRHANHICSLSFFTSHQYFNMSFSFVVLHNCAFNSDAFGAG
jgi:hypothetical protein